MKYLFILSCIFLVSCTKNIKPLHNENTNDAWLPSSPDTIWLLPPFDVIIGDYRYVSPHGLMKTEWFEVHIPQDGVLTAVGKESEGILKIE